MSRPPNDSLNWEAMMMERPLWFQLSPEDSGGGTTERLGVGALVQDRLGNVWRSYRIKGAPWLELVTRVKFTGTSRRPLASAMKQVGSFFLTETGRAIELRADGSSRGLAQYETENVFPQMGGDGSAPAFGSTRAGAEWAAAESERIRLADAAETERIRLANIENDKLLQARTDLLGIWQTAETLRAREREGLRGLYEETQRILGDTLGKDVIRGAIRGQGGVPRGTTPMEGYRTGVGQTGQEAQTALGALGELATPNLSSDLAGTEAQIAEYQQAAQSREPPSLPVAGPFSSIPGLEHGGEIGKKGEVTPYGDRPEPRTAMMMAASMGLTPRIVGERSGGPELALLAKGSKVIPLSDDEEMEMAGEVQGAQTGFGVAESMARYQYDPSTVRQSLSPVYDYLGFRETPTYAGGFSGGAPSLSEMGRLGVQPELVRTPAGGVLRREGNIYRPVTAAAFAANQWDWADVAQLSEEDAARIHQPGMLGPTLTERVPEIESGVSKRRFPVSAVPNYIREGPEGLRGLAIGAPRTIAALLRNVSSQTRDVIFSALGAVGYSAGDIEEELQFFTPSGSQQRPRSALLA